MLTLAPAALSAVPASIPYRGLLTQDDGSPYEGELDYEVALYPCAEAGACEAVWTQAELTATVSGGLLSFTLGGDGSDISDGLSGDGGLWLEVSVDVDGAMTALMPPESCSPW